MKRLLFAVLVLTLLFTGCTAFDRTEVSRLEIVAAYESAGYAVWTDSYDEKLESGAVAYVQANHPDGNYIYFTFFETNEEAKAYEKDLDHPFMKGFFSIIFGDPSWERMDTYGCIVVSYDDPKLFSPFKELLS
jgi:hypothetical protein